MLKNHVKETVVFPLSVAVLPSCMSLTLSLSFILPFHRTKSAIRTRAAKGVAPE